MITSPDNEIDFYDSLLMEYACGALDETLSVLLATHLTLCPEARQTVSVYECMGGVLIEKGCTPVAMTNSALNDVLAQLDRDKTASETPSNIKEPPDGLPLPQPLCEFLESAGLSLKWRKILPGITLASLGLVSSDRMMRLYRLEPGRRMPRREQDGPVLTLVIDGTIHEAETRHSRGTLVISETSSSEETRACPDEGCLCLVVGGGSHKGFPGLFEKLFSL